MISKWLATAVAGVLAGGLLASGLAMVGGCERKAENAAPVMTHEGQGDAVSADPTFAIVLTIDGQPQTLGARGMSIFEAKPAPEGQSRAPQGFEMDAEGLTLAGHLPADMTIAPQRRFGDLVGKTLVVRTRGGDPMFPKMSKLTLGEKVYRVEKGEARIAKAFHKPGEYAGVSGELELTLQPITLGNIDDPQNKGDQPAGEPFTTTGTFTLKARSFEHEQL